MTAPVLSQQQPDGTRKYVHPLTGEKVPSVTTVIGAGIPKPALVPWAARMAARYAVENWDELSDIHPDRRITEIAEAHTRYTENKSVTGDLVHDIIDNWSKSLPVPDIPKSASGFVNQFIRFMSEIHPEFIENEVTLWSRRYGYAGTADWIARINGKTVLGDNKTGRRAYPEVGLQLSALAHTDFIIRPDGTELPVPEFDSYAVLHIRPRSWKLIPVGKTEECWECFLACLNILDWSTYHADKILG